MTIVKVKWIDSSVANGWHWRDRYKPSESLPCESVGYLLEKNKKYIEIVQSISPTQIGEILNIPRSCVLAIKVLK